MTVPLSILDLASVSRGQSIGEALQGSVAIAQRAEANGYRRVWYAEHHNMSLIASSATSVLIAHVAANTRSIRLGSGGIMLPNHTPLAIAEQFGTLAELHPGRIDLGLGRAPGSDQNTMRALRRDPMAADSFPQDIKELQGWFSDGTPIPGVKAVPGQGTHVPLYILGSSLYGATLAAALGLPFGFASHFAPGALEEAVAIYRRNFRPSDQLEQPWVIAGVNVVAADTEAEATDQYIEARRRRVSHFLAQGRTLSIEEVDQILESPQGAQLRAMTKYTAVGTPDQVTDYLDSFAVHAEADELIVVHQSTQLADRLHSIELLADAAGQAAA